jgi:pimeloyl-ACP methyl ester carboxylesterase
MWIIHSVLGLMALLMVSSAVAVGPESRRERCWIDGYETSVRCVSISVPLSYEEPEGRHINLTAVVAPAISARPAADPLFVFPGGPGQAGSDLGRWLNTGFRHVHRDRDIVLVDVRGTGRSDALFCTLDDTQSFASASDFRRNMAACAARYQGRNLHYSAREITEDVERLRIALGYEQINLWGGSFGTRVAQHYARAYPDRIRAIVLDAAVPVGRSLFADAPIYAERAMHRIFAECDADDRCRAAYPHLREDFARLMAQADARGVSTTLPDPVTGRPVSIQMDRDVLAGLIRGGLYADFTRNLIPYAITQALDGDYRAVSGMAAATASWSVDTMALGMTVAYLCAEDGYQASGMASSALSHGFMRDSYYRMFEGACEVWPYEPLPQEMLTPPHVDVPALVISGENDPITPPESGERVAAMFGRTVHVVVPGGLHTNSSNPCVSRIMAEFIRDPQTGGRDHSCLRARPASFLTSPLG